MNPTKRRLLSSVLSGLILLSMFISLIAPLGSLQTVNAQETTEEPPAETTDSADVPAGSPTPEATSEVTASPDAPPIIPTDGTVPTDDLPVVIVPPPTTAYSDDFQDADTVGWSLSEGWALSSDPDDGNIFLITNGAFETATIPGLVWDNLAVSARLGITPGNSANIAVRVGAENYNVSLYADGHARLFQSLNLLTESAALEVIEENDLAPRWYDVSVQVLGNVITVNLDDANVITFTAPTTLPAGAVVFSTGANNTGFIMLDDVVLQQVVASPVVTPTEPTEEAPVVVVIPPTDETTAEATVEATDQVTPEATDVVIPEITAEVTDEATPVETPSAEITPDVEATEAVETTPEAEVTTEVTAEATAEATVEPEVTAEATTEPEATEEPVAPLEPLAYTDFDGAISGWSLSEGTSVISLGEGSVLSMNGGSSISPEPALFLGDFRADASVSLNVPAEGEVAGGLDIHFFVNGTSAYRLAFGTDEIALYASDEAGESLLTSVPASNSADTWYALSLTVSGGIVTLTVDGVEALTYDLADATAAGEISFGATGALLIDNIAIYDLSASDAGAETAVPFALTDESLVKTGRALYSVLDAYIGAGDAAAIALAQEYYMTLDDANRVRVEIWGVDGQSLTDLGEIVASTGAVVINLDLDHVNAYASFESLIAIANRDEVAAISLPALAVSTSLGDPIATDDVTITQQATGTIVPHSIDIIGANIWHEAGVMGAGVVVGVIDTSFAGVTTTGERACLASGTPVTFAGDAGDPGTGHGVNVVEVICDIAPQAAVVMYRASSANVLDDAINRAASDQVDIIVITIDTALSGSAAAVDGAIQSAYSANIPVIASAGNGGAGASTFSYGGEGGRVNIRASAGSIIDYQWMEPAGQSNYPSTLSIDGEVVDSRSVRTGTSVQQYVVPESCGTSCDLTLDISGDGNTAIQVQAAGGGETSVLGGDMIQLNTPNTLTTAANSQNAIAVGAVCASQSQNYPLLTTSSAGPVVGSPTGNTIKPEVVAPSFVQTSLTGSTIDCTASGGTGFGGTSAAAAHVAGMAALLFTEGNTANPAMDAHFNGSFLKPQRLELYLMGHAIELHVGATPDGFDNHYGAGMTVLGSPYYNLNQRVNYSSFADPDGLNALDTEAYYVGNADLFSIQDGSPTNPFFHIETAVQAAIAAGRPYVILQPGEYAGGFAIPDPTGTNSLTLSSFDAADIVSRFGSSIVVTDSAVPADGGGIYIENAQNITVQGIDFTGSSPLYLSNVPELLVVPPSPIFIRSSDTVSVLENTFTYFDQPLQVTDSDNVEIVDNTFDQFIIPFTPLFGGNVQPLYNAAAINVQGTGVDAGTKQTILIERNSFTNGNIRHNINSNRQEAIIRIARMEADIFSNRFVDNIAGATITIDQWVNETASPGPTDRVNYEVVIYSSLFVNNTLYGPLIHLYQGANFQFVNNSVINHDLLSSTVYGSIISVGGVSSNFQQLSDHRFNIINNLFFNNELEGALMTVVNENAIPAITLDCSAIGSSSANNGTRNNWFIDRFRDSGTSPQGGSCNTAIQTGANNNRFGKNASTTTGGATWLLLNVATDVSTFADSTFFLDYDPINPYRLLPYDIRSNPNPVPTTPPNGVDIGDNAAVNAILGYDIRTPPVNVFPLDVMGLPRLIDRTTFTVSTADDIIDLGAYELSDPEPVSFLADDGSLSPTTSEDSDAITFDIAERVVGGFQPYSFAFTNLPAIYDTNPLNPCEGQPIKFDNINNEVTYCPPNDFHTSGAGTPQVTFNYTATGILDTGTTPLGTVTVVVQPTNDGVPTSNSDTQVIFTDLSTQVNYRLRPYVEFSPVFNLSDPDTDDSAGTPSDVDYPFTFSNFQIDTGASGHEPLLFGLGSSPSVGQMNSAIAAAVSGGVFQFTPAPGISGAIEFTYTVTDRDGGTGSRRVRMVVTTRLAGPGLHDDASLDFVYDNGWSPYYYEPAINNTWHYTTTGSSVDFYFIGDAFGITVYGFPGAASMQIALDPDDVGPLGQAGYQTYAELQCTNPAKPANVSTAQTVAKNFVYGCSGVESIPGAQDQLHRLRITNATPGLTLVIDAISVRDIGLPPGLYNDDDFMIAHSPLYNATTNPLGWLVGVPASTAAIGSTLSYTGAQNATMTFKVDGDLVDTMVIYRTTGPGWGPFDVYVNGARRATVQTSASVVTYAQAAVITGIGSGIQNIEIRNLSANYIIIEGIELLAAQSALTEGIYPGEDGRVSYVGTWATYVDTLPNDGSNPSDLKLRYSLDPNAVAVFRINGSGVTIDRTMATGWGQMEVCLGLTNCKTFSGASATVFWGQPATVRSSITGIQTVTVRSLDALPIGIDSIEVIGAVTGLEPGYYEEDDPALAYSGVWTPLTLATALGGSEIYSNDPNAVISFPINPSLMDRLVIHYPGGVGWGAMRVCNGTNCVPINLSAGLLANGNAFTINKAALGLSNETLATITIQSNGGYLGIEAIQILTEAGALEPGYYEETQISTGFDLTYSGAGWASYVGVGPRGNNMRYTNQSSNTATFQVIPNDIDGIAFYHTGGVGYGGIRVCNGGNCQVIPNATPTVTTFGNRTFISKAALSLPASSSPSTITVSPETNGLYIGLEGLHVVAADPDATPPNFGELPVGSNNPDVSQLLYTGTWVRYVDAVNIPSGVWEYTTQSSAAVFFVADGTGIRINHGVYPSYAPFEVCVDGTECTRFSGVSDVLSYSAPSEVWFSSAGVHNVEIRSIGAGVLALASIEVLNSARPVLQSGNFYEETASGLQYSGLWSRWHIASVLGGTARYTADANAAITFQVNTTNLDEIVVFYPQGPTWGSMQICRNTNSNCQTITQTNALTAYNVAARITTASLGLTNPTETVTIRQVSGYAGVEAIQLVDQGVLVPGYYEETPQSTGFNLTYSAGWTNYAALGPRGGTMRYASDPAATATFSVIPNNITGLVIYHTGGVGYGGMRVCNGGTCQTIANASPTATTFGNRTFIAKGDLNLTGGSPVEVSISPETNGLYIGLEALQIMGTTGNTLPLLPDGLNSSSSSNLRYVGTWASYSGLPPAGPLGGTLRYSTDPSAAVLFRFNGDGVALYRTVATGWGAFQMCIDGNQCQTFSNSDPTTTWGQAVTMRANGGVGEHVLEIRSLDALFIGVESIEVLDPVAALTPGFYQEHNPNLTFTNVTSAGLLDWTNWYLTGLTGGSGKYTNDPADTLTFSVNALQAQQLVIYHPGGAGWGTMQVCNAGATSCVTRNLSSIATLYGNKWIINIGAGGGNLDLTGSNAAVTIKSTGGYIAVEGIEVRGAPGPLAPGLYQQDNFNLAYTGTWTNLPSAVYSGGSSIYSSTQGNQLSFSIRDATGFSVILSRFATGVSANMRVCYTRQSNGDTNCNVATDGVVSTVSPTGVQQNYYLYSYYGLPSQNVTNTGPETYNITVTHNGPTGTYLILDGIQVYDDFSTTLMTSTTPGTPNGQPVLYDTTTQYVSYAQSTLWLRGSGATYINGTFDYTYYAGAFAEAMIEGNSVTLYQLAFSAGSRNARFCIVQTGGTLATNLQCSTFSQNTPATTYQSPITLYGFGYDQHHVIFENQDYGYLFMLDGLEVR